VSVSISRDEACEAVAARLDGPGEPQRFFRASAVSGAPLWVVRAYETEARPGVVGPAYVVGPDRRVWPFPADDLDVAVAGLTRLYADGLAGHVDPALLAERVRRITEQHRALADGLVADARAGALKAQHRFLP
jgi:hypothetical protein